MSKKIVKTNASRILYQANIKYELTEYDVKDEHNDGVSVAHKIGVEPKLIYKTLVLKSDKAHHVCLIAADKEVSLKKVAQAFGVKRIELIPVKDLLPLTGYVKGGCSPVGMKKKFPTLIDEPAKELSTFYVSAGKVGTQMKLNPNELAKFLSAQFVSLSE